MVNILILLFVLEVLCMTDTYDFSCPSQSHWKLRAKYKCTHQSNYFCLFDVNRQINVYRERCLNSRIIGHGYKYVFQPNPNLGECSLSRYQPFIFNTTGYSDCVFLKSFCNSEGQTTYKDDTKGSDRTCTCNTELEYHFVRPPNNRCYCHPSIEDCSCYIGIHQNSTTNVLKDLDCNGKINISTQEDALDTSKASQINNFYNTKYNIAFRPTNQYRMKAAVCILVLVVLYPIAVVIYILQRNKRQRRKKIKGLKKVTKAYGAEAVLRTKIKADVRNLTWMHQHDIDNIQEIPSDDCKYSKCDTSKTLKILDLCKKDSGTYFCKVIMPKGTVRYSLKKEVEVIEPVLTLKDSEKRADCGQTVTLKCAIKHPPKHYEVTWEKDADTIQLNDAKYMGSTQDFPHLTIKDVDHGDNALYCFCITYKPSTDEEEKFKCRSKVKLLVNEPSIQMFRLEEQVVMGHNISIECTINQIRKIYDVIWEKIPANNEEYSEALLFEKQTEEKYEKQMSKTKTQHLKIKKADEFDDAFYRCCIQYESAGVDHIVCSEEFRLHVVASAKDINEDLKPDFAMQGAALAEDKIQYDNKNEKAQDQTPVKTNLPVSVNLRKQLNIKQSTNKSLVITTCIKTGNTLVFTDYNTPLIICNSDGTDIHHIPLSYRPHHITEIDSNTVAVSCDYNTIQIINISSRSITSTINTSGFCWGISYNDNYLYVDVDGNIIIHVLDLTGKVVRTIPVPSHFITDITVDRDRLVCIDTKSIYCCSLDGELMWKFEKDEFQDLTRVTTDNDNNVYVADEKTHTVLVVSDDGKHHRELLTESDGLYRPYGIYYDKTENILLVCNLRDGNAFLFDVIKKLT